MTFRPRGGHVNQAEVNRVVNITQFDLVDPNPNPLCLLKRLVNDFDELEVSDAVDWATRVDAIATDEYKKMFQGSNFDRQRFRYAVYGYDADRLEVVYNELLTAFGP